jgi:hypothetical protein
VKNVDDWLISQPRLCVAQKTQPQSAKDDFLLTANAGHL